MNGRRRRSPWGLLALGLLLVPILEIYVLIQVGQVIGAWWTIALLIADSVLGTWLLRREGRRAWQALQDALASGRMPSRELADGALIVLGGALMISPGFVSDAFGIVAILPVTRPLLRRVLAAYVARRIVVVGTAPGRHPGRDDVVSGEVIDPD